MGLDISTTHLKLGHDLLAVDQAGGADNVENALPTDGMAAVLCALVYWWAIRCQSR